MDISVERNAYGRQIDSAIQTGETKLPGGPLEMVYIRAPRIAAVGTASKSWRNGMAFPVLVRQGRLLAATFHPELSSDRRVHQLFVDMVRDQRNTHPSIRDETPHRLPEFRTMFDNFFSRPCGHKCTTCESTQRLRRIQPGRQSS